MGNAIVIVPHERFRWLSGEDHRVRTPLPAEEDEKNVYLTVGAVRMIVVGGELVVVAMNDARGHAGDRATIRHTAVVPLPPMLSVPNALAPSI